MRALLSLLLLVVPASAADPTRVELTVDGTKREALIVAPSKPTDAPPVVFVFHGHGGTMKNAANRMSIHAHWPEAVAVYPQGLPTPGQLTDPEGKKAGWQRTPGDQNDRDLKFFDALLTKVKADHKADPKRVYATGHSNGGGFTYLLWATRGDVFAAVAPSAAAAGKVRDQLKPLPVLHVAGENDPLVKFAWQKAMLDHVRQLNGCEADGKPAGKFCTEYPSKGGTPVVAYIHPGEHGYPAEASARIAAFFQEHVKK